MPANDKKEMKYTKKDILNYLKSQYEFQLEFDPVVIKGKELNYETPIWEWIDICDLIQPKQLAKVYNEEFGILKSSSELESILHSSNSNLGDFCNYISTNAQKQEIKPVKLFGSSCQTASIFKTLISNLNKKGFETSKINPSSNLNPIFLKDAGTFISEINKIAPGVISNYDYKENKLVELGNILILLGLFFPIAGSFIWKFHILMIVPFIIGIGLSRYGHTKNPKILKLGNLNTFRDLVNKMNEQMVKAST